MQVGAIIGLAFFYLAILAIGIFASWKKRNVAGTGSDRAIVAGRDIGLVVGVFTLTGDHIEYDVIFSDHRFSTLCTTYMYMYVCLHSYMGGRRLHQRNSGNRRN